MIDKIGDRKAFDAMYPKIDVIARCRPEDKYAMVLGFNCKWSCSCCYR